MSMSMFLRTTRSRCPRNLVATIAPRDGNRVKELLPLLSLCTSHAGVSALEKVQFTVKRNHDRFLSIREASYEFHFFELKQDVKATKMRIPRAILEIITSG